MITGDPGLDLVAAVFRQAVRDARQGQADALQFLEVTSPDWRQLERRAQQRYQRQRPVLKAKYTSERRTRNTRIQRSTDEDVTSFHQYDQEAGIWTLDVYHAKYAAALADMGCNELHCAYGDGQLFAVSTRHAKFQQLTPPKGTGEKRVSYCLISSYRYIVMQI
mgnify:CR=1 FL=1